MRPTFPMVVLLAAVVWIAACASLLSIDDFTDATGTAGAAGTGTAGAGGGTGGATSTGTGTGTGTAGGGAVPGAHLWSAQYGDDGVENAAGVAVTSAGTIAIAGDFTSSIDFGGDPITNSAPPDRDAFVAMLASDGAHRWTDHIWGNHEEVIESVATDASNSILLAGWFTYELEAPDDAQNFGALGGPDAFFMKINAAGDYQWGTRPTAAGGGQEHATGITTGPGSDIAVVGHFNNWIEFGSDHHALLDNHGPNNAFVVALDSGGNDDWSDAFGVWGAQEPTDVAALDDGSLIVAGNCTGDVTDQVDCGSPMDVFLVKYDGTHDFDSVTVHGDAAPQHLHAVASSGNDFVVVGDFDTEINFGTSPASALSSKGSLDLFVAKLRSDLSLVWSRGFGGLLNDIAHDVAVDATGRVVVTGVIRDIVDFGDGAHDCADGDVFVLVLDQDGSLEWSRRFGAAGDQEGRSVAVDGDGNIVVFGNMQGAIDFGGGQLTSEGDSQDVFLVKLGP